MILDWRANHDLGMGRLFDCYNEEIDLACYFINTETGEVEFYIKTKDGKGKMMNKDRSGYVTGKATFAAPLRFVEEGLPVPMKGPES